jgi:hypothetical protein
MVVRQELAAHDHSASLSLFVGLLLCRVNRQLPSRWLA